MTKEPTLPPVGKVAVPSAPPPPDGGPAFPGGVAGNEYGFHAGEPMQLGMSLLDWFAGMALQGLLASGPHDCEADGIAHDAWLHAHEMLKRRTDNSDS